MTPEGRFENVKRSLFAYLQSNFTESALNFQGTNDFPSKDFDDWVWVGVSSKTHQFIRNISDSRSGDLVRFVLQTATYIKPTSNIMRSDHILDAIQDAIGPRKSIDVYDYVGNRTLIGQVINQGIVSDRDILITVPGSAEGDIPVHVLDFEMQYLAEHT